PITAEENVDAYYPLPDDIVGKGELYMLKVVGESMKDAAILDGDWVIIRSQPTAESGDFVAALLDNEEATVKEFHHDSSGVWLLPHNEAFAPIPGDNATIMGKVVSVIRKIYRHGLVLIFDCILIIKCGGYGLFYCAALLNKLLILPLNGLGIATAIHRQSHIS